MAVAVPNVPFIQEERRMLSRTVNSQLQIVSILEPGQVRTPCFTCCSAPSCLPCCALLPCCTMPEYVRKQTEASRYILLRENSIEWNDPGVILAEGWCLGQSCSRLRVQDNVKVVFFDDPSFLRIRDNTETCHECREFCCGGRGEQVKIDFPCCCGCCLRTPIPFCYIPALFGFLPCALSETIFVEDGQKAVYEIKTARDSARARLGIED